MPSPRTFAAIPVLALLLTACSTSTTPAPAETAPSPAESVSSPVSPTPIPAESLTYTLEEVARHTTPEDCWLTIDGKVYDVSNFAEKHAGGEAVYQSCGLDATELFNTRPMGSGTPHNDKARSFLPNFEIGTLQTANPGQL